MEVSSPKKLFSTHQAACQALFFYSPLLHPSKDISASSKSNQINRWQPEKVLMFFSEEGGSVVRDGAGKSRLLSACFEEPRWGCRHQCPLGARGTGPHAAKPSNLGLGGLHGDTVLASKVPSPPPFRAPSTTLGAHKCHSPTFCTDPIHYHNSALHQCSPKYPPSNRQPRLTGKIYEGMQPDERWRRISSRSS